jgi:hypothetical protein
MEYPVDCGGQTTGKAVAYPTPQPGTEVAIVLVSCVAGADNPPSAVLVYDNAGSTGRAHLRQTLVSYDDDWSPIAGGTSAAGANLSIQVVGYSSDSVPRCCPDLHTTLTWTWDGNKYVSVKPEPGHKQLPAPGNS